MALIKKTFATQTTQDALVRMDPDYVTRAQFATGTGTLLTGTAVAFDTDASGGGFWYVWDGDGSADVVKVEGFVYSDVTLSSSGEVMGAIMTAGEVHWDDILRINVGDTDIYGTEAELKGDIQKTLLLRQLNLRVVGLPLTAE